MKFCSKGNSRLSPRRRRLRATELTCAYQANLKNLTLRMVGVATVTFDLLKNEIVKMHASFSDKFLSQRRESVTSQQDKRHNSATQEKTDHTTTTKWPRAGTYCHVCPHPCHCTTPCVSSHEESGATLQHARARVRSRTQIAQLGM